MKTNKLLLLSALLVTSTLFSCGGSKAASEKELKSYKNEVTREKFVAKIGEIKDFSKKDFVFSGSMTYEYKTTGYRKDKEMATKNEYSSLVTDQSFDYDNKIIATRISSSGKSETNEPDGKEKETTSSQTNTQSQFKGDKYVEYNNNTMMSEKATSYELQVAEVDIVMLITNVGSFSKYYIDGDVFTAVNEENDNGDTEKKVLQIISNESELTAYSLNETHSEKLRTNEIKQVIDSKVFVKASVSFKDVNLKLVDDAKYTYEADNFGLLK